MDYQLELTNVAKHYRDFIAVDNVDLQIKKGEIISLLGSSGCGKTTTLRMIAGLIEPTRGTIRIQGQNMNGVPPHKRDISMVFQNYALFPHLSVYENIVYGLKMRKIRDKNLLKRMNVTAIYVTHDQEEALTISDRIAVMNKGKIEQITVPTELYTKPATKFIAGFVGHANFFEGTVQHVDGDRILVKSKGGHLIQAVVPGAGQLSAGKEVTLAIRPENILVGGAGENRPNLVSGTVTARIYLGSTVRYLVDAGEGKEIEIDLQTKHLVDCGEGDTIHFSLDENNLILVDR